MTSIVGILCGDGVVIGADSSATFGSSLQCLTVEQPTRKVHIVNNRVIVAGTGQIGLGQRFTDVVKRLDDANSLNCAPLEAVKQVTRNVIKDFMSTSAPAKQYGALLAFVAKDKPCLCEFGVDDLQPELKTEDIWYVSMGSAQRITDPFLALMREVYWVSGPPSLQDGVFAAMWTLDHAISVNPGGVNGPPCIATLSQHNGKLRAEYVEDAQLWEHKQSVVELKKLMREFRQSHHAEPARPLPEAPSAVPGTRSQGDV
jgi:ATP-dependent protease HslVU (ClpYQ) peptidase subunit